MNLSRFLLRFVFTTIAWADSRHFYAKINGNFQRLGYIETYKSNILCLHEDHLPDVPVVGFENGVVSVIHRNVNKTFGISRNVLIFQEKRPEKPFKVELDSDFKIKNLLPCLQDGPYPLMGGILMVESLKTSKIACSPVEIYLMNPNEGERGDFIEGEKRDFIETKMGDFDAGEKSDCETRDLKTRDLRPRDSSGMEKRGDSIVDGSGDQKLGSFISTVFSFWTRERPKSADYSEEMGTFPYVR